MEGNTGGIYLFLGFNVSPENREGKVSLEETLKRIREECKGEVILGTPLHPVSGEYLFMFPRLEGVYRRDKPPGSTETYFHPAWQGGKITLQEGLARKERYEAERRQKIANQQVQQ